MPSKTKKIKKGLQKQKKLKSIIFPCLLLFFLIIIIIEIQHTQQNNSHALSNCTVAATDLAIDPEEQKLFQLINTYRQQQNLPALTPSANLNQAAAWLSHDMATNNYLSHADSLGRQIAQRLTDCGYNTFNVANGENIAGNAVDANATFLQWKNSPIHNANMLTHNFIVAGIARSYNATSTAKWYWTLDFGGVTDANNMPSQTQPTSVPLLTDTPIPVVPTPTSNYVCGGSTHSICLTPTQPAQLQPTLTTQPVLTDTPIPSFIPLSTTPLVSTTPTSEQPPTKIDNKSLLTLLLSIIALILEFLKKLI